MIASFFFVQNCADQICWQCFVSAGLTNWSTLVQISAQFVSRAPFVYVWGGEWVSFIAIFLVILSTVNSNFSASITKQIFNLYVRELMIRGHGTHAARSIKVIITMH